MLKSNSLLKPKAHAVLSVAGLDAGEIYTEAHVEVLLYVTQRAVSVAFIPIQLLMAVTPFNYAGDVTALTHSRQYRLVKVVAADSTATATTNAFAALVSANPGVKVVSLEQLAAQVCFPFVHLRTLNPSHTPSQVNMIQCATT